MSDDHNQQNHQEDPLANPAGPGAAMIAELEERFATLRRWHADTKAQLDERTAALDDAEQAAQRAQNHADETQKRVDALLAKAHEDADTAEAIRTKLEADRNEFDAFVAEQRDEMKQQRNDAEHEIADAKAACERFVDEARDTCDRQISEAQASWAAELAEAKANWDSELTDAMNAWEGESNAARAALETELAETRSTCDREIAERHEQAEAQIAEARADAESEIELARAEADEKIAEGFKQLDLGIEKLERAKADLEEEREALATGRTELDEEWGSLSRIKRAEEAVLKAWEAERDRQGRSTLRIALSNENDAADAA